MYDETSPEDYAKLGAAKQVLREEANQAWKTAGLCFLIPGVNVVAWANAHRKEALLRRSGCIDPDEWEIGQDGKAYRK